MAQKIQNVILAGGSGNIGAAILSKLLSSGSFKVSVLSRLESKAVFPAEVKVHQVDYSYSSLVEAFQGQDAVVTALAHDAWPQQIPMIDAAVAAGVKRFIPSEYGSNTLNAKSIALVAPELDIKVATLEYLKKQESTGLTWTGIATGAFFDWVSGRDPRAPADHANIVIAGHPVRPVRPGH
ncbi:Pinoresinol reductase 1-like protein 3 [Phlyctema vagabunda]|uniref:Pinoresinol reductase 1-like protein 3 n=1 Tax=Phlyctema vagabunda TaxID=108571 RepID=A0ABR4P285_9HELO